MTPSRCLFHEMGGVRTLVNFVLIQRKNYESFVNRSTFIEQLNFQFSLFNLLSISLNKNHFK